MTIHAAGIHKNACLPLDCEDETDLDDSDPLLNHVYVGRKNVPEGSNRCICTDLQPRFANSFERKTSFSTVLLNVCTTCRDRQSSRLIWHLVVCANADGALAENKKASRD